MFSFAFLYPKPKNLLAPVDTNAQDVVNGALLRFVIALYRYEETVYEKDRIERRKRPTLSILLLIEYVIYDFGNLLVTGLKSVNVINGGKNIVLTHFANIHRQHFVSDVGHVAFVLGQYYRLKEGLAITRYFDCHFAHWGFDSFVETDVMPISRLFLPARIGLVIQCNFSFRRLA